MYAGRSDRPNQKHLRKRKMNVTSRSSSYSIGIGGKLAVGNCHFKRKHHRNGSGDRKRQGELSRQLVPEVYNFFSRRTNLTFSAIFLATSQNWGSFSICSSIRSAGNRTNHNWRLPAITKEASANSNPTRNMCKCTVLQSPEKLAFWLLSYTHIQYLFTIHQNKQIKVISPTILLSPSCIW